MFFAGASFLCFLLVFSLRLISYWSRSRDKLKMLAWKNDVGKWAWKRAFTVEIVAIGGLGNEYHGRGSLLGMLRSLGDIRNSYEGRGRVLDITSLRRTWTCQVHHVLNCRCAWLKFFSNFLSTRNYKRGALTVCGWTCWFGLWFWSATSGSSRPFRLTMMGNSGTWTYLGLFSWNGQLDFLFFMSLCYAMIGYSSVSTKKGLNLFCFAAGNFNYRGN